MARWLGNIRACFPSTVVQVMQRDARGVQVVALLALSDEGAPSFDASNAAAIAALGIPAFACTPDAFPEMLALAIDGGDIESWAYRNAQAAR